MRNFCIYFFLSIVSIHLACAQIVLTESDLPKPGEVQVIHLIDSVTAMTLTPGVTGANKLWIFPYTNHDTEVEIKWDAPINTTSYNSFKEAYISFGYNCVLYHDWVSHTLKPKCSHAYCSKDSSGIYWYGSDDVVVHTLSMPQLIYPLMNYGEKKVNVWREAYQKSADSLVVTYAIDSLYADSWGTVETHLSDFDVIRIYTKENRWDSLYVNGVVAFAKYDSTAFNYRWYAKDWGYPIMELSKRNGVQKASYLWQKITKTGVDERLGSTIHVDVFPNPFSTHTTIEMSDVNLKIVNLTLFNSLGQICYECKNVNKNKVDIDRSGLPEGVYCIRGSASDGSIFTEKAMIY